MSEENIPPECRELARAIVAEFGRYVLDLGGVWGMDGGEPRFMIGKEGRQSMLGLMDDGQLWAWTKRGADVVSGPVKDGRIDGEHCLVLPVSDPSQN
jgi:hypothetical protein